MTANDYEAYDLLIGMDAANIRNMYRICGGDPAHKISLLLDYTNSPRDVADPWYTGRFEETWNDIDIGCSCLMEYLQKYGKGVR